MENKKILRSLADDVGLNDFFQSQVPSNIVLLIGKETLISYMPTRKKTKGPFGFRPSNATLCHTMLPNLPKVSSSK